MIERVFIFIFGACVGSFLNVCIYRIPKEKSIISPPSHCPKCSHPIAWYDNMPLLSFLLLLGRCRHCKVRISFRYFLIELLTAVVVTGLYLKFGWTWTYLAMAILSCGLIVGTFIDFEYQIIPDEITLGGIVIGAIYAFWYPQLLGETTHLMGLLKSILGILAGGGSIYIIGFLGSIAFKKEAMGGGDVKLMAAIGAFLGWKLVLLTFFLAPMSGAVVGIIAKLKYKEEVIPYGPFLSLAALVSLVWGHKIIGLIFYGL